MNKEMKRVEVKTKSMEDSRYLLMLEQLYATFASREEVFARNFNHSDCVITYTVPEEYATWWHFWLDNR